MRGANKIIIPSTFVLLGKREWQNRGGEGRYRD